MIGPVLQQEMMLAGRRSQMYVFRWIYAGWLILQALFMSWLWLFQPPEPGSSPTGDLSSWFVSMFLVQQLLLMVLATPALAAGSITEEKSRGTLQHLLTADVTASDIIFGKLFARSFQVAALALAGVPLFCFLGPFAGVEPFTMFAVILQTIAPLITLVAASLLASVWCTQTRNAALGLYGISVVWLLAIWWLPDVVRYLANPASPLAFFHPFVKLLSSFLDYLNPVYVLEPAWGSLDIKDSFKRLLISLLAWGSISTVCLGLATWRLRPAYRRQMEGEGKKKKARWWRVDRAPVSEEPIPWKEQHIEGLAPAASLRRFPRWLALVMVFGISTAASLLVLSLYLLPGVPLTAVFTQVFSPNQTPNLFTPPPSGGFQILGIIVMLLASLIVGIRCSGAVSGERERQTWEALLLTPLTTRHLIRGKLWGIMGASLVYVLAYSVPAILLSLLGSLPDLQDMLGGMFTPAGCKLVNDPLSCSIPAVVWTLIWLGVTLLAMYFIGAAGMWASVRAKSSWRSLLWTVGIGYVGGFIIFCVSAFPLLLVALLIFLMVIMALSILKLNVSPSFAVYWAIFQVVACLGLALLAWLMSLFLLSSAQKYVAFRERTMQWKEDLETARPRRRRQRLYR